ncbi:MAG TPA: hypothetical protein VGG07_16065 [Solirubrobacteraceae bacterium]|jgi:hypothetical protein
MSNIRRHSRLLLVAVCCVAAGAAISAIASAGAATSTSHSGTSSAGRVRARAGGLRRLARAVQGTAVVHTASGFANVTFARGKVDAVNGQQLTIAEGTRRATYKTVTVTVPAGAVVRDNRQHATLSDVKAGQRVLVLTAPKRTYVIARTPKAG